MEGGTADLLDTQLVGNEAITADRNAVARGGAISANQNSNVMVNRAQILESTATCVGSGSSDSALAAVSSVLSPPYGCSGGAISATKSIIGVKHTVIAKNKAIAKNNTKTAIGGAFLEAVRFQSDCGRM